MTKKFVEPRYCMICGKKIKKRTGRYVSKELLKRYGIKINTYEGKKSLTHYFCFRGLKKKFLSDRKKERD
jgi:hypothetical protein